MLTGLQMEQFREESRVEERRRVAAVAAQEEAEQRMAELQAAAASESDAKDADAQAVRMHASHSLCFVSVELSLAHWCAFGVGSGKPTETCNRVNMQAAAEKLEQTREAETAPGGRNSSRGGAESDGEGADLQVCIGWLIANSMPWGLPVLKVLRWQDHCNTVPSAHGDPAGMRCL